MDSLLHPLHRGTIEEGSGQRFPRTLLKLLNWRDHLGENTKGSAQQSKKWTREVLNSGSQRRRLEKGSAASTTQHQMGARTGNSACFSTDVLGVEPKMNMAGPRAHNQAKA